jgi:hypothetical protein
VFIRGWPLDNDANLRCEFAPVQAGHVSPLDNDTDRDVRDLRTSISKLCTARLVKLDHSGERESAFRMWGGEVRDEAANTPTDGQSPFTARLAYKAATSKLLGVIAHRLIPTGTCCSSF